VQRGQNELDLEGTSDCKKVNIYVYLVICLSGRRDKIWRNCLKLLRKIINSFHFECFRKCEKSAFALFLSIYCKKKVFEKGLLDMKIQHVLLSLTITQRPVIDLFTTKSYIKEKIRKNPLIDLIPKCFQNS